jgi:hypothetical protein
MTLTLMSRLLPPANEPQPQTKSVQDVQAADYGPVVTRYRDAPSMDDFCTTYGLGDSQVKFTALGFVPGDTPDDLAAVTIDDLKEHGIQTLEWRRLQNAVGDYCAKLSKRQD